MMCLVTVSPVNTAFHSCCLSHHVFDQVNLWFTLRFSMVLGEHCQKIAVSIPTQDGQWSKTWCDRQLWKAVFTGDTVTRLSISIRGRGKSPEEGQR